MSKKLFLLVFSFLIIFMSSCTNDLKKDSVNREDSAGQKIESNTIDKFNTDNTSHFEKEEDIEDLFTIDEIIFNEDLAPFFINYKEGCIVMRYKESNQGICYHEELSEVQRSPLSTFKILSTIILLEEKVVTNLDEVITWDGIIYQNESWNSDQTLRSAFENSTVWVYKKLLSNINSNVLEKYLDRTNYGNKDISGGEGFWLDSSLKISLKEQIVFLEGFYYNKYNFDQNVVDTVKDLMFINQNENYKIYGKTGSSSDGTNLFVGFVEGQSDVFFFATYVKEENAGYNVAKEITSDISEYLLENE